MIVYRTKKYIIMIYVLVILKGSSLSVDMVEKDVSVFLTICKPNNIIEENIPANLSLFTEDKKIEAPNLRILDGKGVKGSLVYEKIVSKYETKVKELKKDCVKLTATFKFGDFPKEVLFKEYGLKIPVSLKGDKTEIKITCGGEKRYDWWYIDQSKTDSSFPKWLLSDNVSRWPVWGIGGVYQDSPTHYKVWKTNKLDTFPLNTDEGNLAPGWIDIIDDKQESGLLVWLEDFKNYPKALTFNYYEKNLYIYFHPTSSLPLEPLSKKTVSYIIYFYSHNNEIDFDELPKEINDERRVI